MGVSPGARALRGSGLGRDHGLSKRKIIGQGRVYETPYFVLEGPAPGPVVLLDAGIHGDETAGVYALYRLLPRLQVQAGNWLFSPDERPRLQRLPEISDGGSQPGLCRLPRRRTL